MPRLYRWGNVYELPGASCRKIEFNISIPYLQTHMIWQNDLNVPYLHFKTYQSYIKDAELKIEVCSVIKKNK